MCNGTRGNGDAHNDYNNGAAHNDYDEHNDYNNGDARDDDDHNDDYLNNDDEVVQVPWTLLPQHLRAERPEWSVVEELHSVRPDATAEEAHAHAARFVFTGAARFRKRGEWSGGERPRAMVAARLFARPVPQLLVVDEPTNNLDLEGVEELADALSQWRGALLLVSHDDGWVVMGRATHQIAVDEGLASGYPHLRQFVVTHRSEDLPAEERLTASAEDPVELVRRLKAQDSPLDIWVCGGGTLAGQVLEEIDEFRLKVNPVILGGGIPLVATASDSRPAVPLALAQRMRRDFTSGVSYVEYVRQ